MEMSFKTKVLIYIVINLMVLTILYNISIDSKCLENICLIKLLTGKSCWNCGMTRAFLSILHLDFYKAYEFNHKVLIVFPLTVGTYLYCSYKYIIKGDVKK